jgi:hypothetical protein
MGDGTGTMRKREPGSPDSRMDAIPEGCYLSSVTGRSWLVPSCSSRTR